MEKHFTPPTRDNIYKEYVDGRVVELTRNGEFMIDNIVTPWATLKNGKPWIPAKRKTFISCVKDIIRD